MLSSLQNWHVLILGRDALNGGWLALSWLRFRWLSGSSAIVESFEANEGCEVDSVGVGDDAWARGIEGLCWVALVNTSSSLATITRCFDRLLRMAGDVSSLGTSKCIGTSSSLQVNGPQLCPSVCLIDLYSDAASC